jgi:UDP-N-acetylmuramoyl-L-alanyl-D-glutamate--2,6-diaminopimelate ligase
VYNVLAATATTLALGCDLSAVRAGLAGLPAIPGRMERVEAGQPFAALVDFAHNAYALDAALAAARLLCAPGGRVIVVFGAAGERDTVKRPEMGRVAGRRAACGDHQRRPAPRNPRHHRAVAASCEPRAGAGRGYGAADRAAAIRVSTWRVRATCWCWPAKATNNPWRCPAARSRGTIARLCAGRSPDTAFDARCPPC